MLTDRGLRSWERTTIPQALDGARDRFGADHGLFNFVDSGVRYTAHGLCESVETWGRALMAASVSRGDRVAVWSPGRPLWPLSLLSVASVGAVVCGLNTRYRADELEYVLETLAPRIVFVATGFLAIDSFDLVASALAESDAPVAREAKIILCSPGPAEPDTRPGSAMQLDEFLALAEGVPPEDFSARRASVTPDDACLIQFTSGSTGHPKGVLISQDAALRNGFYSGEVQRLQPGDRVYSALPWYHVGGSRSTGMAAITTGAEMVIPERFKANAALDTIVELGCSSFQGHGALWRMLLDAHRAGPRALNGLRKGWASGDETLLRAVQGELGVKDLVVMYGSSESGVIAASVPEDPLAVRVTTVGKPVPGVAYRLCEPGTARTVAAGQPGELWVSGPGTMLGYIGAEPPTGAQDGEAWVRTGDLVREDDAGYLHMMGRIDGMLKPGGENVSIAEVERYIAQDPSVEHVVVVGIPDARLGEVPAAVIQLVAGRHTTEAEVVDRCTDGMANFKVPRRVLFVDAIPVLENGKVDRQSVKHAMLDWLNEATSR